MDQDSPRELVDHLEREFTRLIENLKQTGYGREMGKHALELYTQVKSVWVDLSGRPIGWFGK